ncbi:AraC family transcriptional regulator [Roseovarius aestuarii]|nr:AraC family transcriptional regulator [Roseovarius aestuarii]
MLFVIDTMLRGAAISVGLLTCLIILRSADARGRAMPCFAVVLLEGSYLMVSGQTADVFPVAVRTVFEAGAILAPIALTWWMLDFFLDEVKCRRRWIGFACLTVVVRILTVTFGLNPLICGAMAIVLYLGLMWLAMVSARDDLVEQRRRFRPMFVAVMAAFAAIKTAIDVIWDGALLSPLVMLGQTASFLIFAVLFAGWALRTQPALAVPAPRRRAPLAVVADPVDRIAIERINAAMQAQIWRREGLTIGALASELGLPEHRVRRAINQGLGYRNFPAFVNAFRIEAAKRALAAPENAARTILEIAYDSGFASLGPFNRAFRSETGQSPTDFRRMALEVGAPIPAAG